MTDEVTQQINALLRQIQKEAYQQGWDDAVQKILTAAQQGASPESLPVRRMEPPAPERAQTEPGEYATPIIDMVDAIIHERPGLKGFEIVTEIVARDRKIPRKVADRTGRTGLSRLNKRGRIVKRAGRWYPAEEAGGQTRDNEKEPAVGSLALVPERGE